MKNVVAIARIGALVLGTLSASICLGQSWGSSSSSCSSSSSSPQLPDPVVSCSVNSGQPWEQGFDAMVDVTNISDQPLTSWEVFLNLADGQTVNHFWDASLEPLAGSGSWRAANANWNGNLQPGQTARFGLLGSYSGNFVEPECTVTPRPDANFSVDIHGPTVFVRTASQGLPGGAPVIDFGDGTKRHTANAWHTYSAAGEYTITFTVSTREHTVSTSQTITVTEHAGGNHAPVARITFESSGGYVRTSGDLSYDPDGDNLTQSWHRSATDSNVYLLTVFDGELGHTTQRDIPVGCNTYYHWYPSANFTYRVDGLTVYFDASKSYGERLTWYFGDGGSSVKPVLYHTYEEPGEYEVSLQVFGYPHIASERATVVVGND